jgi:hypothetical protein
VVGPFFDTFIKLRNFYISKNQVIICKLSTIDSFYYTEKDFASILIFFGFCHSLVEIAQGEEKI